ncbi:MAG: hypothetical protein JO316_25060 [Abitibacteriaceae bacterium]|nr:hypothetical protein [Abditibacteriaceae bacterium]MBV9868639.1 hypothetical protein [Abditibacteriaceae bacterium]
MNDIRSLISIIEHTSTDEVQILCAASVVARVASFSDISLIILFHSKTFRAAFVFSGRGGFVLPATLGGDSIRAWYLEISARLILSHAQVYFQQSKGGHLQP